MYNVLILLQCRMLRYLYSDITILIRHIRIGVRGSSREPSRTRGCIDVLPREGVR